MRNLRESIRRWSVDGDRLTRVQQWAARVCPPCIEPVLMFGYVTLLFVVFSRGRRAVQQNLREIIPGSSPTANLFRAWRVFWNFGWVITDTARVRAGARELSWEIDGLENFRQLAEMDGGAILLTAHMGNYDIAGPTFAEKFNRKLNAVRAPERDGVLQDYYERKADRQESENFAVRYNAPGQMLAVDLAQMLGRGEVVALQGDRTPGDVSQSSVDVCGAPMRLPLGPHVLSLATGCPIFPLFVVRDGWRRYRILSLPPLPDLVRERGVPKSEVIDRSLDAWGAQLSSVLSQNWHQWLEFEPVFSQAGEGA